jgi:uncharacterized protein YbaR (Trm112 family)
MLDNELLSILCCPETHQPLTRAPQELIDKLNQRRDAKQLRNRDGALVEQAIEGGLVRTDGRYLYPIIGGIPVMLVGEAIPLDQPL